MRDRCVLLEGPRFAAAYAKAHGEPRSETSTVCHETSSSLRLDPIPQPLVRPRYKINSYTVKHVVCRFSFPLLLPLLFGSCGSTHTIMVGQARPATSPDAVRVYYTAPRHFERIAIINSSSGPTWAFTTRGQLGDAISKLKEEAAKLGANGILLEATGTSSS